MSLTFNLIDQRSVSLDSIRENETCNECEDNNISDSCDKCGNGVCKQSKCQWTFPHKFNTTKVICNGCFNKIENKLLNYDHLLIYKFLKNNVCKRRISR